MQWPIHSSLKTVLHPSILIEITAQKLDGAKIADDEGVEDEEAFEVVIEVSEGVIIKRSVKTLLTASCRLLQPLWYFVGSDFYSISSSTYKALFFISTKIIV